MLAKLIQMEAEVVGVLSMKTSKLNSDYADLSSLCSSKNITLNFTENVNSHASIEFIKNTKPDIIFCFGWSRILKEEILNLAPMGVLGYHPARLPSNRGRHPLIWAIALGLKKTASTFFFMDRGADSGDVLSQKEVVIEYKDNAESLYQKIIDTSKIQLEEFLPKPNFKKL